MRHPDGNIAAANSDGNFHTCRPPPAPRRSVCSLRRFGVRMLPSELVPQIEECLQLEQ